MKEFVHDFIGEEIKEKVKKIKLTWYNNLITKMQSKSSSQD